MSGYRTQAVMRPCMDCGRQSPHKGEGFPLCDRCRMARVIRTAPNEKTKAKRWQEPRKRRNRNTDWSSY